MCECRWLGEHVNAVAGVVAWKPPPKPSVKLPFLAASGGAAHSQAAGAGHGADGVHAAAGSAASGGCFLRFRGYKSSKEVVCQGNCRVHHHGLAHILPAQHMGTPVCLCISLTPHQAWQPWSRWSEWP